MNALALVAAPPGGRAHARRARAAGRQLRARPRGGARRRRRHGRRRTSASGSDPRWRSSSGWSATAARSRPTTRTGRSTRPMFGLPAEDDGSRDERCCSQNLVTCTHYEPDFDALRAAPTRIVIAVGAESEGQLARRAGEGVAERLGTDVRSSPATTAGSSAASTGCAASPTRSARRCATPSPDDKRRGRGATPPRPPARRTPPRRPGSPCAGSPRPPPTGRASARGPRRWTGRAAARSGTRGPSAAASPP